jgi:dipeptidase E
MKRLFLASIVANTIDKLVSFLPQKPENLKVAFIATAADPYEDKWFVDIDKKALVDKGFRLEDMDLKGKKKEELKEKLGNFDIIFVAGGNTFYLLEKAKESGFDTLIKDSVEDGMIYVGSSAGASIAGPDIKPVEKLDDPSKAKLDSTEGLNLVGFVVLPHFGKEKYLKTYKEIMEEFKGKYKLVPITDEQAVIAEGEKYKIV